MVKTITNNSDVYNIYDNPISDKPSTLSYLDD